LQEEGDELEQLYATAPVGLCLVDRNLRYVRINERMAAINGRSPADHVGHTIREVIPHLADDVEGVYRRVFETGEPALDHEVRGETAAEPGVERRWLVGYHPLRSGDGTVEAVSAVVQDVTLRKEQDEEHRRLEAQVQHAQKLESLGVLAGGIAHEFNNLLMGILGNADVALRRLESESRAREPLERIKTASQRASELTAQMLAYSGRTSFQTEAVDLNRLVEETSRLLRAGISKKAGLQLDLAAAPPVVQVDPALLRQVLVNLITNAADALGDESGVIRITTAVRDVDADLLARCDLGAHRPPGRYLSLEVSDTGRGMNAATRERMFDPFFTTRSDGRGLGLAAVLGIVRGHEGALRVQSAPGRGTTFTLLLPAHVPSPPAPSEPELDEQPRAGRATILVVDDEPVVREVAQNLLEEAGHRVLLAEDGRQAVAMLARHAGTIDLVFLDMTMPDLSGDQALWELRKVDPSVRVLLTSGYTRPDVADDLPVENLAGFLQKPYGGDELLRRIESALRAPRG
jgi:PAS domain S-box-containing protein